jgi:hypothetical protein
VTASFTESVIEQAALAWAETAGWHVRNGAEKAPTGQARCRHCRQPIERGSWRIRLVFFEEGRFSPGGFVHLDCRKAYFDTDILDQVLHFRSALSDGEREELRRAFATDQTGPTQ